MKKLIICLLVIIIVVSMGAGMWLLWDSLKNEKNKTVELENRIAKLEINEEKSNANETKEESEQKNNTTNESNEKDKNIDYCNLNGTYTRKPEIETAPATLEINNASKNSIEFAVSASSVRVSANESVESAIERGAINIGGYEGVATSIGENKWSCVNIDEMEDLGRYEVILTLKEDNTIQVETIYDIEFGNIYCGNGVTLEGNYSK